jgi:hypothetical protein
MLQKLRPQTPYNSPESQILAKNTFDPGFIQKSTNRRPNPAFEGSRSSKKRHKTLTHDPLNEIGEKRPQIDESSDERKYHEKAPKITKKRETGGATRTLEESRQTFYTHHERFIQVLACLLNIHPSLKILL